MIAVDTNILVNAHRRDSEWHEPANQCIRRLAEGQEPWGVPWPCIHEFLAIATHPRIDSPPTTLANALLWSADRDFTRIAGLAVHNPLVH